MAFINQTVSRLNFRRIAGLKVQQTQTKKQHANNSPQQVGGYKAVYFGDFNNSNTSKK